MWRANTHFIIGERQNGLRDLDTAIAVSSGANKQLAMLDRSLNDGSATVASAVDGYQKVIQQYPDAWKGWSGMGDILGQVKMNKEALGCYGEALAIATRNNELSDPGICWLKKNMGDIYSEEGDLDQAKACYESAIGSCPSHTISHISLCRVNILQGNDPVARDNFRRAQELNPVLVGEQMKVRSYEEYRRMVVQAVPSMPATSQPAVRPTRPAASNEGWGAWLNPVVAPIASVFNSMFGRSSTPAANSNSTPQRPSSAQTYRSVQQPTRTQKQQRNLSSTPSSNNRPTASSQRPGSYQTSHSTSLSSAQHTETLQPGTQPRPSSAVTTRSSASFTGTSGATQRSKAANDDTGTYYKYKNWSPSSAYGSVKSSVSSVSGLRQSANDSLKQVTDGVKTMDIGGATGSTQFEVEMGRKHKRRTSAPGNVGSAGTSGPTSGSGGAGAGSSSGGRGGGGGSGGGGTSGGGGDGGE